MSDELSHQDWMEILNADPATLKQALAQAKNPPQPEQATQSQESPDFDAQAQAEIDALPPGIGYAEGKYNIIRKYRTLRAAQEPGPVDEEIEAIKDDPRALMQLYKSRLGQIRRGDPVALHRKSEIARPFRALGLNV